MCGIVGYVGNGNALPVLLEGMQKLEYRGYDSSGVAVITDGSIAIARKAGRIEGLIAALEDEPLEGSSGIGHTRWATHGAPTDENAHPHRDCTGRLAIVHNGIIENHDVLRAQLEAEGHVFSSQTDTEVAAHLLESIIECRECSLLDAVFEAIGLLDGAYALVCVSADDPKCIVTARKESPIIIGTTPDAGFVASGIPALLEHTRDIVSLDNRQVAEVRPGSIRLFDFDGTEISPEFVRVEWDLDAAEKGGFEDFMLKEIHEQPEAILNTMRGRVDRAGRVTLDEVTWDTEALERISKVVVVACGTSFHAGMAAKHAIEHWTRLPVELDLASEFRYAKC